MAIFYRREPRVGGGAINRPVAPSPPIEVLPQGNSGLPGRLPVPLHQHLAARGLAVATVAAAATAATRSTKMRGWWQRFSSVVPPLFEKTQCNEAIEFLLRRAETSWRMLR